MSGFLSFLRMSNIPLHVDITFCLSIHLSVDTDSFHFLAIVNNVALNMVFPWGSAGKESTYNMGDLGSTPGLGRSPGEGRGCTLHYSGLETSMDYSPLGSQRFRHN